MQKQALVIRHLAFEDLGVFGPVLQAAGYRLDMRQAGVQAVPADDWRQADLVVVLGGPIGVGDAPQYPWLAGEIDGLRQRLRAQRPTLGICLGAQLMAAALGATVRSGPAPEIGWAPVDLSAAARQTPLRHLHGVPVLHWHGDTFDLPAGSTLLASTALTPHQAFAIGRHALALQFHAEVAPQQIEAWLIGHALELRQAGISPAAMRAATRQAGPMAAAAGQAMLQDWLHTLWAD